MTIEPTCSMPGVQKLAGTAKTARSVAAAGTDLLLYSSCPMAATAANALAAGLAYGSLPRAEFEASVDRILTLRSGLR